MSGPDRRHAVGVARDTLVLLADGDEPGRDVVASALLHDVGKVESGLGTFARVGVTVAAMGVGRERLAAPARAGKEAPGAAWARPALPHPRPCRWRAAPSGGQRGTHGGLGRAAPPACPRVDRGAPPRRGAQSRRRGLTGRSRAGPGASLSSGIAHTRVSSAAPSPAGGAELGAGRGPLRARAAGGGLVRAVAVTDDEGDARHGEHGEHVAGVAEAVGDRFPVPADAVADPGPWLRPRSATPARSGCRSAPAGPRRRRRAGPRSCGSPEAVGCRTRPSARGAGTTPRPGPGRGG